MIRCFDLEQGAAEGQQQNNNNNSIGFLILI